MLSEKKIKHINKLNSLPRNEKWCKNISNGKKNGKYLNCLFCDKIFWSRPSWIRLGNKYCSRKCYGSHKSTLVRGENNSNWQGGINDINSAIRHSKEYKKWRIFIFNRDNYTCQKCGQVGGELNADHIKPFSLFPKLRFNFDNGRTLCVSCHRETFSDYHVIKLQFFT